MEIENQNVSHSGLSKEQDHSSVLQVRLSTEPLIEQFKVYLTGKVESLVYDEKKGENIIITQTIADPKANAKGQQWILNHLRMIVNPSTVQANFIKEEMFYWYITRIRLELAINLMKNKKVWEIKEEDYGPIIASFMDLVYPFMTRPLANKERESYGSFRVVESSTVEQRNKKFNLFNKTGG